MFEALTEKLSTVFRKLGSKGRLTEKDVEEALREVRVALLEADVHFRVAREFIAQVRERALDVAVLESLTPGQQVVRIVHEELIRVLGGAQSKLALADRPPTILMLVGLQGSGKTTTAAKLALHLSRQGQRPLLVAADVKRPAAVQQLVTLGKQLDIPVYEEGTATPALDLCEHALRRAAEIDASCVILDTAGRLHIDEEMMAELVGMKQRVGPQEVLLVADAMTGQDAVRTAQEFHQHVELTGLILTKMDGDARGGAALSITAAVGLPIKFIGVGEKPDALEPYYPDRLASRILGMGDMLTLIEKAQATVDVEKAKELEKKLRSATFNLEDFLDQLGQVRKMGPLSQLTEMIPGLSALTRRLPGNGAEEKDLTRAEAMIHSMTPRERHHPEIIGGSRRRRIARGSGTTPADINRLLNQFEEMRKMVKQISSGRGRGLTGLFG